MESKSKPKGSAKEKKARQAAPAITDARFEAVQWDPRFQRFPKKDRHVEIDKRFEGMFKNPEFQQHSIVDKRGRKVAKQKNKEDMKKYYKLKDEDTWRKDAEDSAQLNQLPEEIGPPVVNSKQGKKAAPSQQEAVPQAASEKLHEEASESSEDEESAQDLAQERWARARGLLGDSSSSEEEEEDAADAALSSDESDKSLKLLSKQRARSSDVRPNNRSADGVPCSQTACGCPDYTFDTRQSYIWRHVRVWDVYPLRTPNSRKAEMDARFKDEEALVQEWGIGAMAANPDERIPETDETTRLAVVDLDWDKIRAVDILAVLRSFLVKGQSIKAVSVYPSDFGLQKMKEEAAVGPQSIFSREAAPSKPELRGTLPQTNRPALPESDSDEAVVSEQSSASSDAEFDGELPPLDSDFEEEDEDHEETLQQQESSDDSGEDVDQRRLQLYERSRLRYYYAVVECQDVATAAHLYAECDGMEFLRSACKLDMRFVPDEQSFVDRQLRDSASNVPGDYTPPDFTTVALQHTNVKLTWDADDDTRKKALRKKMTEDTIRDDDFKAYLASSSSEEEDEGQQADAAALRERYRGLLLGGGGGEEARTGGRKGQAWTNAPESEASDAEDKTTEERSKASRGKKDANMDMEVTFIPGLKGLGARLLAQKQDASKRKGDTVWDAYLRRQKEKKLAAKAQGRRGGSSDEDESDAAGEGSQGGRGDEQDPFFQHEDDPFSDPFFKDDQDTKSRAAKSGKPATAASKRTAGGVDNAKATKAADQQRQAQLEMLMLDDNALQDMARIGGKLQPVGEEEELPRPGHKGKAKVSRKERLQKKRDQKRAEREAGSDDDDINKGKGFEANLQDPRFKSLFTSADYALDPTDPRFKQLDGSKAVAQTVAHQQQRRQAYGGAPGFTAIEPIRATAAGKVQSVDGLGAGKTESGDAAQLKSMVASLKRKASKQAARQQGGVQDKQAQQPARKKKQRTKV